MQDQKIAFDDKPIEEATVQEVEATGAVVDPEHYPKLDVGQVVVIDGFEFTIDHFNSSSIVLKPCPTRTFPRSAKRCMYHLRGDLGEYKY